MSRLNRQEYLDITTVQSTGVSPFFGGLQMYWTAEAQTRTETEPQFKQMELKAWELSGYCVSSNVLLQDSIIGLEKFLMTLFAKSIAWFEEYAFLQGNGAGKPQGMLTAGATLTKTRDTGGQVDFNDVATMWFGKTPLEDKLLNGEHSGNGTEDAIRTLTDYSRLSFGRATLPSYYLAQRQATALVLAAGLMGAASGLFPGGNCKWRVWDSTLTPADPHQADEGG